ncbi:hypothetical protein [Pseudomonas phage PA1C]|uniref:Uncharacterized protein n=1 Tax=Pseudomonas phage vB_PaeM_PS119XW TaxID=2601632 RepID=A0A5C1K7I2_9CAUD|nr:hypothetical protein PP933_gp111 [Pseudomonas phage vB_PaeM_PS119XW]QBX32266.1 hypothetical protein [Pseudomonas phage PA1C]QEM41840.1 hypothetical protein [Pseudomonas phage vB_PaeM_PS119XW]BEG72748.1 hypothetical protein RVBP21_3760 [Pseudomonas phage BRkr]
MFYDHNKPHEENEKSRREYAHNRELMQYATAGIALITAAITLTIAVKKAVNEFT